MRDKKEKGKTVRVGPLLQQALEKQKKNIKEATYNCVEPSDYEAGEIIAKKVNGSL